MARWSRAEYPGEYTSYTEMKRRVKNEQRPLDEAFATFQSFMEIRGPKPSPQHTLDRIDASGTYSPDNTRWATKIEQANNRRNTRFLTYNGSSYPDWVGDKLPLTDWARRVRVPAPRMRQRLSNGWSETEAIDGERAKVAKKRFSNMTQNELAAYRPWQGNEEEAEARYLRERRANEARLEFRARMIGEFADHKWQALYALLKEPDEANLNLLRHSKQARDALPRRKGVTDEKWQRVYAGWEKVKQQLSEARLELAEWSAAVAGFRSNSAIADREVLKRLRGQGTQEDDVPDPSWLE